jgi:hypothetical protein
MEGLMGLQMLVDQAKELAEEVWEVLLSPREVQQLGSTKSAAGARSVLLVSAPTYNAENQEFRFDASDVVVLNLGTSSTTIVIGTARDHGRRTRNGRVARDAPIEALDFGPGDRDFLRLVEAELMGAPKQAAIEVLKAVRSTEAGDLKRGQRLNFKNTPDNFWYVIVQPRAQSLSITVRGLPERFQPSALKLKMDRPGYTRFILDRPDQVDEALRIIHQSRRK